MFFVICTKQLKVLLYAHIYNKKDDPILGHLSILEAGATPMR